MFYTDEPSMRVFKYPLSAEQFQEIEMPIYAKILSVHIEYDQPYITALIKDDCNGFPETRTIRVARVGDQLNGDLKFIGTVVIDEWSALHVFEVINKKD